MNVVERGDDEKGREGGTSGMRKKHGKKEERKTKREKEKTQEWRTEERVFLLGHICLLLVSRGYSVLALSFPFVEATTASFLSLSVSLSNPLHVCICLCEQ